jgi:hypothetical protein
MASHKYRIGQDVRLRANRMSSLVGSPVCKIMRQLPIEDGSYLYRINASPRRASASPKKATSPCEVAIKRTSRSFCHPLRDEKATR